MRIVVIGATGNVGTATISALVAADEVDEVVGVARRVPDMVLPKVRWRALDIESDDLGVIDGADAVIHLAWKIQPQHDERAMAATNIGGTRRVLAAVQRLGVPVLVVASSVGAYAHGP